MKAAVLKNWLDLELCDIPVPVPGENEALIKVKRAGVCGSDITVYRGKHMTATVPTVLCHEILGTIESLPEGYDGKFKLGQRVLMNPIISCGKRSALGLREPEAPRHPCRRRLCRVHQGRC